MHGITFPAHEETILTSMASGGGASDTGMRPEEGRGARRAAWRPFLQLLRCHPRGSSLPWQPEESFLSISSDFQPHPRRRAKPRGSFGLRNVASTGASGFMRLLPPDTPAGFYCPAFILLPPGPALFTHLSHTARSKHIGTDLGAGNSCSEVPGDV